jgi:hypothetical protein
MRITLNLIDNMKNRFPILLLAFLCIAGNVFSQNKTEKFCKVHFASYAIHGQPKTEITVDYGQRDSAYAIKDTMITNALEKIKSFNSDVSVFNYMASLGWQIVSTVMSHVN